MSHFVIERQNLRYRISYQYWNDVSSYHFKSRFFYWNLNDFYFNLVLKLLQNDNNKFWKDIDTFETYEQMLEFFFYNSTYFSNLYTDCSHEVLEETCFVELSSIEYVRVMFFWSFGRILYFGDLVFLLLGEFSTL